jgi:eukaryotic-like serine/threonine-protein kinase
MCLDDEELVRAIRGEIPAGGTQAAHLAECAECRAVVALARTGSVTGADFGKLAEHILASVPPQARGTTISRYLVLDVLGTGGMGIVYAAYDAKLDRKVALKLLHPVERGGRSRADVHERLYREAQALARLRHPNVITVYDVGTHGEDLFVAMELIEGGTLTGWLQARPRSVGEIVGVFRQAGSGLEAAHAAGLVHRDFKPDNVLVGRDGRVCVTDFGLAVSADQEQANELAGTPAYMAPEQLFGKAADARSDLFSFCATLYEALYGTRPFTASSLTALRQRVREGEASAPESGKVPAWLRRVVLRGLRARPEERHPSMTALLAELARVPGARRRRWLAVGGAGLMMALGALTLRQRAAPCGGAEERLAAVWNPTVAAEAQRAFAASGLPQAEALWGRVARALDERGAAWARARRDACEATRVRGEQSDEMLDLRMACLDGQLIQQRELVDLFRHADSKLAQGSQSAVDQLDSPSSCAADALVRGHVKLPPPGEKRERAAAVAALAARARALEIASRYADEARVAGEGAALAEREQVTAFVPNILYEQGLAEFHVGHVDEAQALLRRGAQVAQAHGRDDVAVRSYGFHGYLAGAAQKHFGEAHLALDVAEGILERMGSPRDELAQLTHLRGRVLVVEGKREEAIADLQRARDLYVALGNVRKQAEADLSLSKALTDSGRHEDALAAARRATEAYERLFGPDYFMLGRGLLQQGFILDQLHRQEESLATLRRAAAISERALGPHAHVVEAQKYVAYELVELKRPREAIPVLEAAVALGEKVNTPYPDVAESLGILGHAHELLGELPAARREYERALAHPKFAQLGYAQAPALFGLARVLWSDPRERARAVEMARRAQKALAGAPPGELIKDRDELAAWLAKNATAGARP